MAIKDWSSTYPTAIDTATNMPPVVNGADVTRASQINSVASAGQALQQRVGMDSGTLNSLWRLVNEATAVPDLQWDSATQVSVVPQPGAPSTMVAFQQDGKIRSVTTPPTFSPAVSGEGGLESGSEAADTWYYLYLVPLGADDSQITVIGSTQDPGSGPSTYTKWTYVGAVFNNSSSDLIEFDVRSGQFYFRRSDDYPLMYTLDGTPTANTWASFSLSPYLPTPVLGAVQLVGALDGDAGQTNRVAVTAHAGTPGFSPSSSTELHHFLSTQEAQQDTHTRWFTPIGGVLWIYHPATVFNLNVRIGASSFRDKYLVAQNMARFVVPV